MARKPTLLQRLTLRLADLAHGPKSPWSNLRRRILIDTMPADVGACVMCLYLDGAAPEPWIVIGERPDRKNPGKVLNNGSGGGFGNLCFSMAEKIKRKTKAFGEQHKQMAVREWNEENRTADNRAVCDLDPEKLYLVEDGVGMDYRAAEEGRGLPVAYAMYYTALDAEQAEAVKRHAANMEDPAYRAACFEHSGRETARMRVMRLSAAAELPIESFAHPHEGRAIRTLQTMYRAGKLGL